MAEKRGGAKMAEKKRIIRVMFAKIKEAYHKLSEEEQKEFMRKDREKMEELGYKLHFMIDCSWSNEEWQFIGIEEWLKKFESENSTPPGSDVQYAL